MCFCKKNQRKVDKNTEFTIFAVKTEIYEI